MVLKDLKVRVNVVKRVGGREKEDSKGKGQDKKLEIKHKIPLSPSQWLRCRLLRAHRPFQNTNPQCAASLQVAILFLRFKYSTPTNNAGPK